MRRKSLCFCLLLCLLNISVDCARADDNATVADLRCVVVGTRITSVGDAQHRAVGTVLTMYYVGKLAGRTPGLDLEKAIMRQLGKMKSVNYNAEARRCAAEISAKGRQLVRIAKDSAQR